MNKFKVLNELQRCVEKVDLNLNMPTDCWMYGSEDTSSGILIKRCTNATHVTMQMASISWM